MSTTAHRQTSTEIRASPSSAHNNDDHSVNNDDESKRPTRVGSIRQRIQRLTNAAAGAVRRRESCVEDNVQDHRQSVVTLMSDEQIASTSALPSLVQQSKEPRFAPMDYVLHRCALCFDETGRPIASEIAFASNFFLVHQWFLTSVELVTAFQHLYSNVSCATTHFNCPTGDSVDEREGVEDVYEAPAMTTTLRVKTTSFTLPKRNPGSTSDPPSSPSSGTCAECSLVRQAICHALHYWMETYLSLFGANAQLKDAFECLQKTVLAVDGVHIAHLLDTSSLPSFAWLRGASVKSQLPIARQTSLSFEQWTPTDIAYGLTHIEYKALRRITFNEYKQYAASSNLQTTPILERSISLFNSLSHWVQCMVLNKASPKERAEIMVKFINVGVVLYEMHNYNTLMSVIGGLSHSAIARLTKTYACIPMARKREFTQLAELLSHASNFGAYRRELQSCTNGSTKIPIIGVHLKDLIGVNCAPDFDESPMHKLNTCKVRLLAEVFQRLIMDIDSPGTWPEAHLDLVNTIKVSLDIRYKDEEIYELSQKREPRSLLTFSTSHKSCVFADWAAGVKSAPDQATVKKHIAAMVDAVFKHYDHDRDDYISQVEFNMIAGNFPFIEPFQIIDEDRDGRISRQEMNQYFVRVNQYTSEFRRGFQHNFHETTFLGLATCIHCNKRLWGIYRQGFKCKDCAIQVHPACKDSVVAECRARNQLLRSTAIRSQRSASLIDTVVGVGGAEVTPMPMSTRLTIDTTGSPSDVHNKRRTFLNIRLRHQERPRLVSENTANLPSPEMTPGTSTLTPRYLHCAESDAHCAAHKSLRTAWFTDDTQPSNNTLHATTQNQGRNKRRSKSEKNDRCQSPECADISPTLASEEVFDDD